MTAHRYTEQGRQCVYKYNTETHLHNNCCRGKALSIYFWVSVCILSYPACKAHALYYTVICGLSGSDIILNSTIFR
jgi:hypothetical protein